MKYVFSLILLIGLQPWSYSQDAKAEAILQNLSKKFEGYTTIYAEFESFLTNKEANLDVAQKGKIFIQGDKYNLEIDDYQIINNGELIWTVSVSDGEIYIDAVADQEDEDLLKPSELFSIWKTGFKSKLVGKETLEGLELTKLKLYPIDPASKPYHTIILEVIADDNELFSMEMLGKNGDNFTYLIETFKGNPTIPTGTFQLDEAKYQNYEIIDNR